jgi:putative DNA primase/helicase
MTHTPDTADRLTIKCGPPDRIGKCKMTALFDAKPIHYGHFNPFSQADRADFAKALSAKLDHDWAARWWTLEGNGDAEMIHVGDKVIEAANAIAEPGDDLVVPRIRCLADVAPEPVRWLWEQRIAEAKLSLLAGDPGLGKSFITLDIAARVSTGAPWPDHPHERRTPGGVVILSAEDGLEDTIRPRLDAAGADVQRIMALSGVEYRTAGSDPQEVGVDLTRHLSALERAVEQTAGCALVIVDPITAYMGDTDSHKNAEVRAMLARLAELAVRCNVAILAVTHLNKASTQAAIYRAMGSLGFVAAARAVWAVVKDKDDLTGRRRLLLPVKNNLGNDESGLAYRLSARHADGNVPVVEWEPEPVSIRADDAMSFAPQRRGPKPDARNEAVEFLRSALAKGPRLGKEIMEEAREAHGIAKTTLTRAKKELKVESYQGSTPGPWYWKLPHPKDASSPDSEQPGKLGNLGENTLVLNGFGPQESQECQVSEVGERAGDGHLDDANRWLDEATETDAEGLPE